MARVKFARAHVGHAAATPTDAAQCLGVFVIGVVKGGTSELVRTLRDSYEGVLQGPTGGPWHANSEVMWCTPHCPGHSAWGVFGYPSGGVETSEACDTCGLLEQRGGLPAYYQYEEACRRPGCWAAMLSEHFGTEPDAGTRLAKNPDAFFWPHLASIYVQRAIQCGTKLLLLLRDPVQRTLSHFGWYWRKMVGMPGAADNATAAFSHWLDLSFDAYAAQLRQFTDNGAPRKDVWQWSELCYGLESPAQRKHWAPYLGLVEPSGFTHDGLAFVKGLPQSVYLPQLLTWRSHLHSHREKGAQLLRAVQSERLRCDPSELGRVTAWLGLGAAPGTTATSSDDGEFSSAAQGTKPRSAVLERRLVNFLAPLNTRLFEVLAEMGQPFDAALWQAPDPGPGPKPELAAVAMSPWPIELEVSHQKLRAQQPPWWQSVDHHAKHLLLALLDRDNPSDARLLKLLEQLVSSPFAPAALVTAASSNLPGYDEPAGDLGGSIEHDQAAGSDTDIAAPDVVFLHRTPEVGSAQARGEQISAHWPRGVLLGWDNLVNDCASLRRASGAGGDSCAKRTKGKLVVHIKEICKEALQELPYAAHVYDPLDKGADQSDYGLWDNAADHRLCGLLAHGSAHASHFRRKVIGKPVWEVPHHAMPRCKGAVFAAPATDDELAAVFRRKTVVVVGGHPPEALRELLTEFMAAPRTVPRTVLFESDECVVNRGNASLGCLCALLARSSVAIAWDQLGKTDTLELCKETTGLSVNGCYALKPNERFVNPLSVGLPTVGFHGYPAFREATEGFEPHFEPDAVLLAKDLPQLERRLKSLLGDFVSWRRARELGLKIGARFALPRTVELYEHVRQAAVSAKLLGRC